MITKLNPKTSRKLTVVIFLSWTIMSVSSSPAAPPSEEIDIPYTKFILDNGLTLIVHEDHKAPIVAVNIWYHVGSKDEKPGKTGFAHLFEHLMFNGSEHYNDDYFKALERLGATDLNGTTSQDRTNYFQNVPKSALDAVLWMESDRMGYMIGAIDQARLDEQRGVVQNEKRQYENQPYGKVWNLITENTYPAEHPYSWTVIGSMDDLNAASLEDVHHWFETYYGAANAVISIAGDVDTEQVKERVQKYFGSIPSGPPVAHQNVWIAKRSGTHRQKIEDRVPQIQLNMVWNVPQWGSTEGDYLNLVADVLGGGKSSRLYRRLVMQDRTATDVSAFWDDGEIAGQFHIRAMVQPGGDVNQVEQAVNEELQKFLDEGPTPTELQRVRTRYEANFIRGVERIGGFGGKSDILARNQVYGGNPEHYKITLDCIRNARQVDLQDAARKWLDDGVYILQVHPFGDYSAGQSDVDRSQLPEPSPPPRAKFPELHRAVLSNGLKVILAQRRTVPLINFNLLFKTGFAADSWASPGTTSLAMNMMDEGTQTRSAVQISEELELLGARLSTGARIDSCSVYLSALKSNLDESLEIFADVIMNPAFDPSEFQRLQKEQLANIEQEKNNPFSICFRLAGTLLYGPEHPYGVPFTGAGDEESVGKLTADDLKRFHQAWIKPNNATLVVVGDTSLAEIIPKLEKIFAKWPASDVPFINIPPVAAPAEPVIYIVDRPDSIQSNIMSLNLAGVKSDPDEIACQTLIDILGGSFTSRINMNLREDKHWSYGARCWIHDVHGRRPLIAYTSVQTDKTAPALKEIHGELHRIITDQPPTEDELVKIQKYITQGLAGRWETINAVSASIGEMVIYNLPDDYFQVYADKIMALSKNDLISVIPKNITTGQLIWLVVGDRKKIETDLRELNLAQIRNIDVNGQIIP